MGKLDIRGMGLTYGGLWATELEFWEGGISYVGA
jgi:hypothetical protein